MENPIRNSTTDTTIEEERTPSSSSNSTDILNYDQVVKLLRILKQPMVVHSHNNFPNLSVNLVNLIQAVKQRLRIAGVPIHDVRLNGSAASFVMCSEPETLPSIGYKDLDLVFHVDIDSEGSLYAIKEAVLSTLIDFMPQETAKDKLINNHLEVAYVKKMVKIFTDSGDRWSLISLNNLEGRNVDLKFVYRMRRQYEFTADSFHILLDSLMVFMDAAAVTEDFFPNVEVLSVFGDIEEALYHLNNRQIYTVKPEEIRGGGLLKYCYLTTCGYQLAVPESEDHLHQLMCVRFFIDFPTEEHQLNKYTKYLTTHFSQPQQCMAFLNTLLTVVMQVRCIRPYDHLRAQQLIWNLIHYNASLRPQSFVYPMQAVTSSHQEMSEGAQQQVVVHFPRQQHQHPTRYHHSYQQQQQQQQQHVSRSFSNSSTGFSKPIMSSSGSRSRVSNYAPHGYVRRQDTPPTSPFPTHFEKFEKNLPPRMQRPTVVDPVQ